jgi:hypothetical protein
MLYSHFIPNLSIIINILIFILIKEVIRDYILILYNKKCFLFLPSSISFDYA